MDFLKLKIFDVLTEKISVSEFENWLYNSEEFMNKIGSDNLCFQVVSINYKKETWSQRLNDLVKVEYDEDDVQILSIERACLKISQSKTADETYQYVRPFLDNIDYNSDYHILLRFYDLDLDYNSFRKGMLNPIGFMDEAKFYSKKVIENLKNCENLSEKKEALKRPLQYLNSYNLRDHLSLKQKIFAFLKKI